MQRFDTPFDISESNFSWTIARFGLRFPSEAATLASPLLVASDGSRWRLRCRCDRWCPESMVRVYVRSVTKCNILSLQ